MEKKKIVHCNAQRLNRPKFDIYYGFELSWNLGGEVMIGVIGGCCTHLIFNHIC